MATYRVYLAAAYAARDTLRDHLTTLADHGIAVTSTWLHETGALTPGALGAATDLTADEVTQHCINDFADIDAADAVVLFTGQALTDYVPADLPPMKLHTGGRHVETGYALATGKPVIVIGDPENVFHRGMCTLVPTFADALTALTALRDTTTEQVA